MTDKEFDLKVQMIVNKNKNGLKDIYEEYGRLIYQLMLNVVKSPQDAEDLTSDFFLKLWEKAGELNNIKSHKGYITVMAKNMAIDFLRKQKREIYSLDDEDEFTPQPLEPTFTDELAIGSITFEQAIEILSPMEKEIINLHLGWDLTFKQISKNLGKPLGTVTWKYRQAISKLQKTVKEGGING